MEQQQTYESGLLLLHPEDNPRAAPGLAQPLSREEGHCNVSAELYLRMQTGDRRCRDMLQNNHLVSSQQIFRVELGVTIYT